MKPTLRNELFGLVLFSALCTQAQIVDTITIGSGTSSNYFYGPVYRSSGTSTFDHSAYNTLYDGTELALAGLPNGAVITGIAWNKVSQDSLVGSGTATFRIYMKETSSSNLTSGTTWSTSLSGATLVDSVSMSPSGFDWGKPGWKYFMLDNPMAYNGGSLEVLPLWNMSGIVPSSGSTVSSGSFTFQFTAGVAGPKALGFAGLSAPTGTSTLTTTYGGTNRINIRIIYSYTPPSCTPPTLFSATSVGYNTAQLQWTSTEPQFEIEYGIQGFTPGTGTTVSAIAGTSQLLMGLLPSTTYDAYVRSNCPGGLNSAWIQTSFTTACLSTAPISEPFTSLAAGLIGTHPNPLVLSNCWAMTAGASNAGFRWETEDASGTDENSTATGPHFDFNSFGSAGGMYLFLETSSGTAGDSAFVTTPFIDISGLTAPELAFYYHMYGATTGSLSVAIFHNGSWSHNVWSISGQQQTSGTAPWTRVTLSLTGYTGPIRIRFKGTRGSNITGDLALDQVSVAEQVICNPPSGLSATPSFTSASLAWTPYAGASDHSIQYGLAGFNLGSGTTVTTASNPYNLTGLNAATAYEYYVRTNCSVAQSNWVGPFAFSTLACSDITAPVVAPLTYNSAEVSWPANAAHGTIQLEFGLQGFTPGSGSTLSTTSDSLILTGLNPTTAYDYYLRAFCAFGNSSVTGPFSFTTLAQVCDTVQGFALGTVDPTSAVLQWTGSGNYQSYQIEYGVSGFTPGSGTTIANASNPTVLMGLTPNTAYQAYVRGICSFGNGPWSMPLAWTTPAQICTPPTGAQIQSVGTNSITLSWIPQPLHTSSVVEYGLSGFLPGTGTAVAASSPYTVLGLNPGTAYDFYIEGVCSFGSSTQVGPLSATTSIPPCPAASGIAASNITTVSADVSWTAGAGVLSSDVEYGPIGFVPGTGTLVNSTTGSVSLSGLNPATQYEVYVRNNCSLNQALWVGPVSFTTLTPVCNAPSNLSISNVGTAQATVSWTAGMGIVNSVLEYGPTGFTPGTGMSVSPATSPLNLTGLSSATAYDVYVRSQCALSNSAWIGPVGFTTLALNCPIAALPMAQDVTTCGPVPAVLTASAPANPSQTVLWMNVDSAVVADGLQYTTPAAVSNLTYFAAYADESGSAQHVGPLTTIATPSFGNFTNGMWFEAFDYFRLDSVTLQSNGAVSGSVQIWTPTTTGGGTVIASAPFSVSSLGVHEVPVGLEVSPGVYFINIGFNASPGQLFRTTSGAVYPYVLPGVVSIDSTNFTANQTRWYYLFDWVVSPLCVGPLTQVDVTSGAQPSNAVPYSESFALGIPCNYTVNPLPGNMGAQWTSVVPGVGGNSLNGSPFLAIDDSLVSAATATNGTLESPGFNTVGLDSIHLEFDQYYRHSGSSSAKVEAWDGAAWVTLLNQTATSGAWGAPNHVDLNVTALANPSFKVRFTYDDGNAPAWFWAIDNLTLNGVLIPCEQVVVNIVTDIYGSETTWEITDTATGLVYASGGPYADVNPYNAALATHIDTVCLPLGGYFEFRINDSFGDGLFDGTNNGTYTVSLLCPTGAQVLTSGTGGFANGGTPLPSYDSAVVWIDCTPPAQSLTFRVNMSQQTVSPNGVHVAGNWQDEAGYPSDWDPSSAMMTDPDGDGVYELIVTIPAGTYEYKFINGNAWGSDESVPGTCAVNQNRQVVLSGNTVLPIVCFAGCTDCIVNPVTVNATFSVNMALETVSANGVHIAGNFQGWNPATTPMTDPDGDMVYTVTLPVDTSAQLLFKFINGNDWPFQEVTANLASCGQNDGFGGYNRLLLSGNADTTFPVVCFSSCVNCPINPNMINLSLAVDMSEETVSANGVHVAGTFNNWDPASTPMLDPDGDMVYEVTVMVPENDTVEFRYINGNTSGGTEASGALVNCGVPDGFGGYNRFLALGAVDFADSVRCFTSCDACDIGVEEWGLAFGLVAYPNPTDGMLVVRSESGSTREYVLELSNLNGSRIATEGVTLAPGAAHSLDLSVLPKGVYLLRATHAGGTAVVRVLKD
ncbi:T9SS type A sorting domain-containing protein [bacterium]|nr:T9SS type A sorting domain-containing protein [bacterium]